MFTLHVNAEKSWRLLDELWNDFLIRDVTLNERSEVVIDCLGVHIGVLVAKWSAWRIFVSYTYDPGVLHSQLPSLANCRKV